MISLKKKPRQSKYGHTVENIEVETSKCNQIKNLINNKDKIKSKIVITYQSKNKKYCIPKSRRNKRRFKKIRLRKKYHRGSKKTTYKHHVSYYHLPLVSFLSMIKKPKKIDN